MNYVKDKNGNEEFKAFEISNIMHDGVRLLDGELKREIPLACGSGIRIQGKIKLEKLEKAINKAYQDIDSMRAEVSWREDGIFFKVKEHYEYKLELKECAGENAEERLNSAKGIVQNKIFQKEYYADTACPIEIYKLEENDFFIFISVCHALMDGQAMILIIKKILAAYTGLPGAGSINKKGIIDYYEFYENFKNERILDDNTEYATNAAKGLGELYKFREPDNSISITDVEKSFTFSMKILKKIAKTFKTTVGNVITAIYMAAIASTYNIEMSAITSVSANRAVPDFFNTAVIQLDLMLLKSAVKRDGTLVKEFFKETMKATSDAMKHTPSYYSKVPSSRFMFSYAQDAMVASLPGIKISTWMPDSLQKEVLDDQNYVFLFAFETGDEIEFIFLSHIKTFNAKDYLNIKGTMEKMLYALSDNPEITMNELMAV